ncbi:MAG: hypothetical protein BHW64_07045 [Candidatus Melainabacteria bacterium LEY3_CP_29_8]|nr:MAG: hypothetical protein BHW64_07045 [Candidatus Melainabacteria bacterium LEY3_CP_29_8]
MKNKIEINGDIILTIINDDNFLSPYSPTYKPIISSEVAEFIENCANEYHPKTNLILNIYSNCIDENEKETYNNAIKNYFTLKLNDVTREIKRTVFTGILFSIVGIIVLALMFLLSNLEAKAIWIECVNIFAWVFLWEGVDKLFIERNKLLLKISRLSSFINMKINYYNK